MEENRQYVITFWGYDADDDENKKVLKAPTTKEMHRNYYNDVDAKRIKEQRHGRCTCPKSDRKLCNNDCATCKYQAVGDTDSLNEFVEDSEGNQVERIEIIPSNDQDIEAAYEEAELKQQMYKKLKELDPVHRKICQMIMAGKSERKMVAELNIPKTTLHRLKEKALKFLSDELKDYYF